MFFVRLWLYECRMVTRANLHSVSKIKSSAKMIPIEKSWKKVLPIIIHLQYLWLCTELTGNLDRVIMNKCNFLGDHYQILSCQDYISKDLMATNHANCHCKQKWRINTREVTGLNKNFRVMGRVAFPDF